MRHFYSNEDLDKLQKQILKEMDELIEKHPAYQSEIAYNMAVPDCKRIIQNNFIKIKEDK